MNDKRYDFGTQYTGNTGAPAIIEKADGKYILHADHERLNKASEYYADVMNCGRRRRKRDQRMSR